MSPELARFYAHVHPAFWPWLWLQLKLVHIFLMRHDHNILVSVTRRGCVRIVQVGDHRLAWRRPEPARANWDDPVWESSVPGNILSEQEACVFSLPAIFPAHALRHALRTHTQSPAFTQIGGAPIPDTS